MLVRIWSKGNTHELLVAIQTCTATMEIVWWFLRKMITTLPQDPAFPLFVFIRKGSFTVPQGHLLKYVNCYSINNR